VIPREETALALSRAQTCFCWLVYW